MISVPLLTPYLSSLWLGLVTPVYARIGRKLVEGLRNPTMVRNLAARDAFLICPRSLAEAIRRAAVNEDGDFAETRWSDSLSSAGPPRGWGGVRFGMRIADSRSARLMCRPTWLLCPSSGSAVRPAGTTVTSYGSCGAGSICWSAAWAFAGDAGIRRVACGRCRGLLAG